MTKRAFVVGIDDYHNWQNVGTLSFPSLHYCCVDAEAFAGQLIANQGFEPADVLLCENAEATLTSILTGVQNMLMQSQPGDVACFYFAGHGGCVPEDGWGHPSSRYYQSIVPYDGAGMIFDEQFLSICQSAMSSGVNLTIILDTGHAGQVDINSSGVRGFGWDVGMRNSFVAQARTIVPLVGLSDPSFLENNISRPQAEGMGVTMTVNPDKNWVDGAQAILLSACDFNQMATETPNQSHGLLTTALLDVMNSAGTGGIRHDQLLQTLQQKVGAASGGRQTPQLRGRLALQGQNFLNN
jgi:hypothetical protein